MKTTLVGGLTLGATLALLLAALSPQVKPALAQDTPEYLGADGCKSCHFKTHKSWKKTPLANAFEVLKPGQAVEVKTAHGIDPQKDYCQDATCLRCHTTGYGTASGYPEVGGTWGDAEKERAERNQGVGCEACHGPGSLYVPFKKENKEYKRAEIVALGAVSPPTAEQCMQCHVKECPAMPEDYTFDFETAKTSDALHEHVDLKYNHD